MATVRFSDPRRPGRATLSECSGALTALFALDAHMQHHLKWLAEAAEAFGKPPHLDDEQTKDARAVANAQTDRMRALRTRPRGARRGRRGAAARRRDAASATIVEEHEMPFLPDTLGPKELVMVERSFSAGMARYVHSASISLRPLRTRLEAIGDDETTMLAGHIDAFLAAVHA